MLNKAFYWTSRIVQALFLIAACGIQYFSVKKMGMMRYVVFKNHEWEAKYNAAELKYVVSSLLLILFIAIILYLKNKKYNHKISKEDFTMIIVDLIITLVFLFFTLMFTTESYRSYYYTFIFLSIIVIIQHIKILMTSILRKKCLKAF